MAEHLPGEFPPAYFITFSTHGTRLHGDDRGTVNRWRNRWGEPPLPPAPGLAAKERSLMKGPAFLLDTPRRIAVDLAIRERCRHMAWEVFAVNVRTNHVHVVLSAASRPEPVMNSLKARATRALREQGLAGTDERVWTRHGSTRYLWTRNDIESASAYTLERQGDSLD